MNEDTGDGSSAGGAFSDSHPVEAKNGEFLRFPRGFLWGTATSTTQIEGHIRNEWTDFVAQDGRTCNPACDSYHRYPEDIEWMRRLGVNAYRMGIEWSRLQPAAYAPLDDTELARYSDQLDRLNASGIAPMVVLHHFSNPPWVNESGGWVSGSIIPVFVDYVARLVTALRGRVRFWNTFNEPDTYACCSYFLGQFPPRYRLRMSACRKVVRHMAEAHRQACRVIRRMGSDLGPVEVGFSKNWTSFQAYRRHRPWDSALASFAHSQFNEFVLRHFLGEPGWEPATFLGVNYYGQIRFRNFQPLVPTFGFSSDELAKMGVACDDMLERHPEGMEIALKELSRRSGLPIYLTEHGSASTNEAFRARDLRENLAALHRALELGVDVRGFYYWSLMDNFEWQFGYAKKFGLIGVDFNNPALPRQMKPLGQLYSAVCRENAIPAAGEWRVSEGNEPVRS